MPTPRPPMTVTVTVSSGPTVRLTYDGVPCYRRIMPHTTLTIHKQPIATGSGVKPCLWSILTRPDGLRHEASSSALGPTEGGGTISAAASLGTKR